MHRSDRYWSGHRTEPVGPSGETCTRREAKHSFQEADVEALPFSDGEFDVVMSMFAATPRRTIWLRRQPERYVCTQA
jgi:hypothetical protein